MTDPGEGRAMDVFLLISERILKPFHPHRRIYLSWAKRETGRWTDNCPMCQAQRDVTSNTEPSWRPVTSGVKLGGVLDTQARHATVQKVCRNGHRGTSVSPTKSNIKTCTWGGVVEGNTGDLAPCK